MFVRIFLFLLVGWLLVRAVLQFINGGSQQEQTFNKKTSKGRKVSGDTGEYVDFEEIDD